MKEIKFRCWDKQDKIMWQPLSLNDLIEGRWELETENQESTLPQKDYLYFAHKDSVWMQYTGLKDLNNKPIYEGDIISVDMDIVLRYIPHYSSEKYIEEVSFSDGQFNVPYKDYLDRIEIIGNIFEGTKTN